MVCWAGRRGRWVGGRVGAGIGCGGDGWVGGCIGVKSYVFSREV